MTDTPKDAPVETTVPVTPVAPTETAPATEAKPDVQTVVDKA